VEALVAQGGESPCAETHAPTLAAALLRLLADATGAGRRPRRRAPHLAPPAPRPPPPARAARAARALAQALRPAPAPAPPALAALLHDLLAPFADQDETKVTKFHHACQMCLSVTTSPLIALPYVAVVLERQIKEDACEGIHQIRR
ncbi:Protein of unknown function, partial [Gryllus bimaculatus]